MSCSAKNSLATPVQLNVNTILKVTSIPAASALDSAEHTACEWGWHITAGEEPGG